MEYVKDPIKDVAKESVYLKSVQTLVHTCGNATKGERALIVSNLSTQEIGNLIEQELVFSGLETQHFSIPPVGMHGVEPPVAIAEAMQNTDLIFGLTRKSMAHTKARLAASLKGARYLSLPEYNWAVLSSPALQVDFRAITPLANRLADLLTQAEKIHFTTEKGTDLWLSIHGRRANPAPGWCFAPGALASPPDAEVNIPPVEHLTEGVVVVDGSIPCDQIGLLTSPIILKVEQGFVTDIQGAQAEVLTNVFDQLKNCKTRVIAEFGIGLNPNAELKGDMLEDEGCLGTVHLGIGSNKTIGGENSVPFHLDHLIRDATVEIDGRCIIRAGVLLV